MFGYRHGEVPLPMSKLDPKKIKKDIEFHGCVISRNDVEIQKPISRTLPIYFVGAANYRPDPDFPPNVVIGCLARVGMDAPKVDGRIMAAIKNFTLSFCHQYLTPLDPARVDFYTWIESTPYTRKRKDNLIKTWEANPSDDPGTVSGSTDNKSFIKDEAYPEPKAPRAINSKADWFKCYSGPLFGAIGKDVFQLEWFIKTVPVRDQPEHLISVLYDLFSPISNNDATSYEAHFKKIIMTNIEFVVYFYMCQFSPIYMDKMHKIYKALTGKQTLFFKHVWLTVPAMRCSGEMNTSLGNGLTTVLLVLFIAWVRQAIVRLKAEGDDNLSVWQFEDAVPTERDWAELGWVMKVERPNCISSASFCGNIFDLDDQRVIVDPRNALLDFGWVRKAYVGVGPKVLKQLLRSKALSMAHQYNGCPILGLFGRHVVGLTKDVIMRKSIIDTMNVYDKEQYLAIVVKELPPYIEPTPASRFLVNSLYGISIDEQICFERSIEKIQLWSAVELNFLTTTLTEETYSDYTAPVGEPWVYPKQTNFDHLEQVIRSFGKITSRFVDDFYV